MADNLIYRIVIYRVDGNHMMIFESESKEQIENVFNGVNKEWVDSTAEKRPFRLPPPVLHSMLPSLIAEIKVESFNVAQHQQESNPYYQEMQRKGLQGMMDKNFNGM